jgi:hypothetical protein
VQVIMLSESRRIALGVAAWAMAVPSAVVPGSWLAIRPEHSHSVAISRGARAACPDAAAPVPDAGALQLRLVRFYRAKDGMTQIWAFLPVPPAAASPDPGYEIALRVRDSTYRTIYTESWSGVRMTRSARTTPRPELLHFLAAPGAYHLEVDLLDSGAGRLHQGRFDFRAYEADPGASDLLLAPLIRLDASLDGAVAPGEFRHGASVVTPAAVPCVSRAQARVFYLLEVYLEGMHAQAGTMEASVTDPAGHVLASSLPVAVTVGAGGAVLQGQMPVEGLAPGAYALRVQAKIGARTVERAAPFLVDSTDFMHPVPGEPGAVPPRLTYQE